MPQPCRLRHPSQPIARMSLLHPARLPDSDHAGAARRGRRLTAIHPLSFAAGLVALLIAVPILVVAASLLTPSTETWHHLADTVLGEYIANTLWLLAGVAIGVLLLGVPTAWLVCTYRFPGRGLMEWALVLPLAMPAYVIAYAYTDAFDTRLGLAALRGRVEPKLPDPSAGSASGPAADAAAAGQSAAGARP